MNSRMGWFIAAIIVSAQLLAQNSASTKADSPQKKRNPPSVAAPQGITRDQADAILDELRQIRQLLERQQTPGDQAGAQPSAPPQEATMTIQNGWYALGSDNAPVTLVEFTDYECPFCRTFHTGTFPELKKNYIDTGKVHFVSRDLPLEFHSHAMAAAQSARCAGEQGKFWEMRDALISNSSDLSQEAISKYAQSVSLDGSSFRSCLEAAKSKADVQRDLTDAASLQISGTPTFVLGTLSGNTLRGVVIVGAQPYQVFDNAIQQLLKHP